MGGGWYYGNLLIFSKGSRTMFIAVLLFCSPIVDHCVLLSTKPSFSADIECSAKIRETVELARDKMPSWGLLDASCKELVGFSI